MSKKQPIWEKKTVDKRKSKVTSIRMDSETDVLISEKAKELDITRNEFIITSCLQNTIRVIPEGKEILEAVQDAKTLIREFPLTTTAKEADAMFSKVICRLYTAIS
ncbi:hypothetical protein SPSIL_058060 [Sporomusa silvacetica DSM 10669]|uniref:Uncharacterized protein n=1 Tax=Sporomusa silvacetica DSM 10669 TaxID=1123289 RepID=A0ABZ3IV80_9FIRM|nr:hypothetical protein [Sporomusa silvacetica]OZC14246.1 hypothetical protein SPSIL_49730 [Sporomusa silvacetica DSM 10669]